MNHLTKRFALSCLTIIAALLFMPALAYAGEGEPQELMASGLSTQTITSESVAQSDAGTTFVTVEWGVPAADSDPNKAIYSYLVSWRVSGSSKYSSPKTISYGKGTAEERTCKIAGLKPNTTYEVRVGYRYQNLTGGQDTWINVPDWRSCTAYTQTTGTTGASNWGYYFMASNKHTGWFGMKVTAAKTPQYSGRYYEWAAMTGSKFSASKAKKLFAGNRQKNVVGGNYEKNYTGKLDLRWGEIPKKTAVVSIGVRSKLSLGYPAGDKLGAWRTKTLIADPLFSTSSTKSGALKVTIPPLKDTQSYTIYVAKRKSGSSGLQLEGKMKVTGWKKVATVGANSSKSVSAVIGKYGKTKLGQHGMQSFAVKVVTHTKYGNSPGRYWLEWH